MQSAVVSEQQQQHSELLSPSRTETSLLLLLLTPQCETETRHHSSKKICTHVSRWLLCCCLLLHEEGETTLTAARDREIREKRKRNAALSPRVESLLLSRAAMETPLMSTEWSVRTLHWGVIRTPEDSRISAFSSASQWKNFIQIEDSVFSLCRCSVSLYSQFLL